MEKEKSIKELAKDLCNDCANGCDCKYYKNNEVCDAALDQARGLYNEGYIKEKRGKWLQEWELEKGFEDNSEIPYIKCSLCGNVEWHLEIGRNTLPNYCSNCGAKMVGDS